MWSWIKNIFSSSQDKIDPDMKYLIVGLGNVGADYEGTRHNIGFDVVDELARRHEAPEWDISGGALFTEIKYKGRHITLIKPTTFMNRSGSAFKNWVGKLRVNLSNTLVVVDDLHLDLGELRLKNKGSDGGHNGLKDIARVVGSNIYPRLRVGIGKDFHPGQQVNYVLGKWKANELKDLPEVIDFAADAVESYAAIGAKFTMEKFNRSFKKK